MQCRAGFEVVLAIWHMGSWIAGSGLSACLATYRGGSDGGSGSTGRSMQCRGKPTGVVVYLLSIKGGPRSTSCRMNLGYHKDC